MPVLLFVAFIVVPLVELFVISQVSNVIGVGPTIVLLVLDSLAGAWLVRREGRRAWASLTGAFGRSASPVDELTQGALIVFGGALLLTPGFVTDVLGLACVLPLTRPAMSSFVRRTAAAVTARRMGAGNAATFGTFMGSGGTRSGRRTIRGTPTGSNPAQDPAEDQAQRRDGPPPDVEIISVERMPPSE